MKEKHCEVIKEIKKNHKERDVERFYIQIMKNSKSL